MDSFVGEAEFKASEILKNKGEQYLALFYRGKKAADIKVEAKFQQQQEGRKTRMSLTPIKISSPLREKPGMDTIPEIQSPR